MKMFGYRSVKTDVDGIENETDAVAPIDVCVSLERIFKHQYKKKR